MNKECPVCDTKSVIEEEESGKIHHVCMECGHIVKETAILAAEAPQVIQYLSSYKTGVLSF